MTNIQRARELLAAEIGQPIDKPEHVDYWGTDSFKVKPSEALRAIERALSTPPDVGEGDVERAAQAFIDAAAQLQDMAPERLSELDDQGREILLASIRAALASTPPQAIREEALRPFANLLQAKALCLFTAYMRGAGDGDQHINSAAASFHEALIAESEAAIRNLKEPIK